MTYYSKMYNYRKSDFEKNFINKVISPSVISRVKTAYRRWENNRVFFGEIKNNRFKVYTYPDYGPSFINPILFFKNALVFIAPVYISGRVEEVNGKIDVKYKFSKSDMVYIIAIIWVLMCLLFFSIAIISVVLNGINATNIVIFTLSIIVPSILLLRMIIIPRTEKEALQNLLDSLAQD